ncbi:uncharacterized protein LOC117582409 isoform X2 [Drosophila guanche]|uniref:uncharacterized protein LOC117582409 isoform X2 n=1 Tax=Drosophila guanche TaxID=7266 RepID=UPI001470AEE1|nr:uncharacterized protein LOC117582409 isoform X2 [Drosophila guanche]
MQYMSDEYFRKSVNVRILGRSPPYYPGRVSEHSVPPVDEFVRRAESMTRRYGDNYLDGRRDINSPPPPVPPPEPQNADWLPSPRRNAFPLRPLDDAQPNERVDLPLGDYSKEDTSFMDELYATLTEGRGDHGSNFATRRNDSPIATRRTESPIATRRNGSPIATRRNQSPIATRRNGPTIDLASYMNIFSENLPGGRADKSPTDARRSGSWNLLERIGSPVARGRSGSRSPTVTQCDYANAFRQNLPDGPAPMERNMDSMNPMDPHFRTQTSNQGRRLLNAEPWSDYDENYDANRSYMEFNGDRRSQNHSLNSEYGNRSFENFDANRSSYNFDANRSFDNYNAHRSLENFDTSLRSFDGNRSSFYSTDYLGGNDSGFINERSGYGAIERRNFGNFGNFDGSKDGLNQGYTHRGINSLLTLPLTLGSKRMADEFELEDRWAEKRSCLEETPAFFRVGGYKLKYASHNPGLMLPQTEELSHACNFIEAKDMADGGPEIRHTISEEWKTVYREKGYRSWGSWWSDFRDCGAAIRQELDRFDGFDVKKNFQPPEGPIDSEEYLSLAISALKQNNITYLKNMRDIYRLVDFNVLENLTADASGHLQDIIRFIPNHLWRYKMRGMVYLWTWYQKMANCGNTDDQTHQAIMPLWNNPILHWLAKQAFDELIAMSKIEYKKFKEEISHGLPKQINDPNQEEQAC